MIGEASEDVDALAAAMLHAIEHGGRRAEGPRIRAQAFLASQWLADRDARIRAEALESVHRLADWWDRVEEPWPSAAAELRRALASSPALSSGADEREQP